MGLPFIFVVVYFVLAYMGDFFFFFLDKIIGSHPSFFPRAFMGVLFLVCILVIGLLCKVAWIASGGIESWLKGKYLNLKERMYRRQRQREYERRQRIVEQERERIEEQEQRDMVARIQGDVNEEPEEERNDLDEYLERIGVGDEVEEEERPRRRGAHSVV